MVALLLVAFGMRLERLGHLPPGLFHDEAYNVLDAQALAEGLPHPRFYDSWEVYARVIHTTWPPAATRFPAFLEGNYGREPLFHYVGAAFVALIGPRVWSLRLVAAMAGTLAIAVVFRTTRTIFAAKPERSARLAVLASAVAVGIYSLLAFSRLGLRIIILVVLEGLTVGLWWQSVRSRGWRWWALAGLTLGLSQYTYVPARLLPVVVAYPVLMHLVRRPRDRARVARGLLVAVPIALIVSAPLIGFFVRYPAYFLLRAQAINADTPVSGLAVIAANVGRVAWGLVGWGDPNPILNVPGRPLLDASQAAAFVVGVIVCLRRVRRTAYSYLLVWAVMMHLPSVVSGIAPTFGRSIGAVLPVVIVIAIGIEAIWAAIERWRLGLTIFAVATVGALCFSIVLTARDYFSVWAQLPGLARLLDEEMAVVGRYIGGLPNEALVYMTPSQKRYATLLVAMGERERPRDFYGPAGLLPVGEPDRDTVYLLLDPDVETAHLLETTFPDGRWDAQRGIFSAYSVHAPTERALRCGDVQADFARVIRLLCYDSVGDGETFQPGDPVIVRLAWQALDSVDQRHTAFVHLLGFDDTELRPVLWAQDDHEPGHATYATDRWSDGEVIMDTFELIVPLDIPDGQYTLTTGFYRLDTLERLPCEGAGCWEGGDVMTLGTIDVAAQAP